MKASTGDGRHAVNTTTRATFVAPVRKAFAEQSTLINRPEHCSLDPDRLAEMAGAAERLARPDAARDVARAVLAAAGRAA